MVILGKLIAFLFGPAAIPVLIIGVLAMGGKMIQAERSALRQEGQTKCDNEWKVASLERERDTALALAQATTSQKDLDDKVMKDLKDDAVRIKGQFDSFVREATLSGDRFCVSQRVLDLARGVRGTDGGDNGDRPAGSVERTKPARPAK